MEQATMKVEIWSDVMCPFCYIGKRRFEKALSEFPEKGKIEIEWKSFQLNPAMKTELGKSINEYLAEQKGWSLDYTNQMSAYVTAMAAEEGLEYHLDKAVVANSFDAHRLIQLAKKYHKGDEAEEQLFKAYFTEGKNIADHAVLSELGKSIGLDGIEIEQLLASNLFAEAVEQDSYESRQVGVQGVPFFVFNQQHAVSGAQDAKTFLSTLTQSYKEFQQKNPTTESSLTDGPACAPEGNCDTPHRT